MEVATAQQLSNSAGAAVANQQQYVPMRPTSAPRGLGGGGSGQGPSGRAGSGGGGGGGGGGIVEIPTGVSRAASATASASLMSLRATREAFAEQPASHITQQPYQQQQIYGAGGGGAGLRSGSSSLFNSPSAPHRSTSLQPRSMLEGKWDSKSMRLILDARAQ